MTQDVLDRMSDAETALLFAATRLYEGRYDEELEALLLRAQEAIAQIAVPRG